MVRWHEGFLYKRTVEVYLRERGHGQSKEFEARIVMTEAPSPLFPDGRTVDVTRSTPKEAVNAAWDLLNK